MTTRLLDGRPLADSIQSQVAESVARMKMQGGIEPRMAVVLVGQDAGSLKYAEKKQALCRKVGMDCQIVGLGAEVAQAELLATMRDLAFNPAINGIFVEFPLPPHLNPYDVLGTIPAEKDVEGMTLANVGRLAVGTPLFMPTTPAAVMRILEHYRIEIDGRHAVIVGRSNVVGRPLAAILLARNATVTICHSKTVDLARHTSQADILLVAVGRPRMFGADMIKKGAVVVDIGTNYTAQGLVGDVDFEAVRDKTSWITPVPGGVGPVTTSMILDNVLHAALLQAGRGEQARSDAYPLVSPK